MYTVTDRLFPYIDSNCSRDFQQFEDYYSNFQETNASMGNPIQASGITEYDLGGEGDLFKAPEPIIEEPSMGLDPMTATISMISCGEGAITTQGLKVADLELIESEQLLNEVFYECKKDLMEKTGVETSLSDVLNVKLPNFTSDENIILKNEFNPDASLSKSVSSGCLSSTSWMQSVAAKPTFLEFSGVDFGSVYGMRRSFSEGDIKTLGNTGVANSPRGEPMLIGTCINEDRMEKLSRYRSKKSRRNFGRKIKYACRKALADNQPRIRGRFAKIEESDVSRSQ